MDEGDRVEVRMFGLLHTLRREAGLPSTLTVEVPPGGTTARALALSLGLPLDRIEGVFVNRRVHGIEYPIAPGDRVAFVPHGTPGPHRFCLGLYDAGKDEDI